MPPCTTMLTIPATIMSAEKVYAFLRAPTKSKSFSSKKRLTFLVRKDTNCTLGLLRSLAKASMIKREINSAEKSEQAIPIINTMAKPFTPPVPKV